MGRVVDMTLAPRVLAFCKTPRTLAEIRAEFGHKGEWAMRNMATQRKLVNLAGGPGHIGRFQTAASVDLSTIRRASLLEPGKRVGMLTLTRTVGTLKGRRVWLCTCDCGGERLARDNTLSTGSPEHCGCRGGKPMGEMLLQLARELGLELKRGQPVLKAKPAAPAPAPAPSPTPAPAAVDPARAQGPRQPVMAPAQSVATASLPPGVKVTVLPSVTHDPRYQVAPGERVLGGFATAGIGRYLEGGHV
jgi:hypothetical protein